MSGRGVEESDRIRRDYIPPPSSSSREKVRSNNPPSRHLWVGSVSPHISEPVLAGHFLRFGELENISIPNGRGYAFINFKNDEDAIAAMDALQGFNIAGMPIKIEFAKADKSQAQFRGENYLHRQDESQVINRSSSSQRESRKSHERPESFFPDNHRPTDCSRESPSEDLWIGYPAFMKVDETILKRAFSPFGDIERITVFSSRNYAFVRFSTLMSACRAKETLQGKLFGNPRVRISFARNETGSSKAGSHSAGPNSTAPGFVSNVRAETFNDFPPPRNFGNISPERHIRPPRPIPEMNYRDTEQTNFSKKLLWIGGGDPYEHQRLPELCADMGVPDSLRGHHSSPFRDRGNPFHDSRQKFAKRSSFAEESWESPEDPYLDHGAKRPKIDCFPPDKEFPHYPLFDSEQSRHEFPLPFPEYAQQDEPIDVMAADSADARMTPHNIARPSLGSLSSNPVEQNRPTPDFRSHSSQEWKWEGTIAKGGNPVCRARCFPVGRVMDLSLPELLDFTARTSLEMLGKHYYEAAGSWVVFFIPESDSDIGHYNEFLNYLGEKQRVAVAKINEKNTLFLVPPSEFSEKTLKVPGKLSISGVVLRLEAPSSNVSSRPTSHDVNDAGFVSSNVSNQQPESSSERFPPMPRMTSYQNPGNEGAPSPLFPGSAAIFAPSLRYSSSDHPAASLPDAMENRQEYPPHQRNTAVPQSWSMHQTQSSVSGGKSALKQPSMFGVDPASQEYRADPVPQNYHSHVPRVAQGPSTGIHDSGPNGMPYSESSRSYIQESTASKPLSMSYGSLQPEQLIQLASSLIGQQKKAGNSSAGSAVSKMMSQLDNSAPAPNRYSVQPDQVNREYLKPRFDQQKLESQRTLNVGSTQHDHADAEPQKRLESTLQLAAALLQQIRGKAT